MKALSYFTNKELEDIEKIRFIIVSLIQLSLVVALFSALFNGRWLVAFVSVAVFVLTFLPTLFKKSTKINLPIEFELVIVVFIYASIFLGEVQNYYHKFWWWDAALHTFSAFVFGIIGFLIMYALYQSGKIKASPGTIAMFAFAFAFAIGGLWEIFEFSMDQIFGFNMQKNGLVDTMWDLIVDAIGALVASVGGYIFLKGGEIFHIDKVIKRFLKHNPNLFK